MADIMSLLILWARANPSGKPTTDGMVLLPTGKSTAQWETATFYYI